MGVLEEIRHASFPVRTTLFEGGSPQTRVVLGHTKLVVEVKGLSAGDVVQIMATLGSGEWFPVCDIKQDDIYNLNYEVVKYDDVLADKIIVGHDLIVHRLRAVRVNSLKEGNDPLKVWVVGV